MIDQPPPDLQHRAGIIPKADEKNLAMLSHLTGLLGGLLSGFTLGIVGPLILYIIQKEKSEFVTFHAKESLNHQITFLLVYLLCGFCTFVGNFFCIGFLFLIPLGIAIILSIVLEIIACVQASHGEWTRIPWSIRLVS
ncbi:MAG: hypothetical protein RI957_111 [Verrucomicrobiota bacterium]|jgi:uncharacterized Tic20 family protein